MKTKATKTREPFIVLKGAKREPADFYGEGAAAILESLEPTVEEIEKDNGMDFVRKLNKQMKEDGDVLGHDETL